MHVESHPQGSSQDLSDVIPCRTNNCRFLVSRLYGSHVAQAGTARVHTITFSPASPAVAERCKEYEGAQTLHCSDSEEAITGLHGLV